MCLILYNSVSLLKWGFALVECGGVQGYDNKDNSRRKFWFRLIFYI